MRRFLPLLVFCLAYLILKVPNIGPRVSDENWYFYAAYQLTRGTLPYRDFFIAHPPGQILFYAGLMELVGFNLTIIKAVQLIIALGTAFILFLIVPSKHGGGGLFAAALWLSASVVLTTTDFAVGASEAAFFLTLAWYLVLNNKPKLAGLSLFLGLVMRTYILPAALGLSLYEFWRGKRSQACQFLLYGLVPFILTNLALYAGFGEDFLTPVWRYHLLKLDIGVRLSAFGNFLRNEKFLLGLALVGGYLVLRKAFGGKKFSAKGLARQPEYVHIGLSAIAAAASQVVFLGSLSSAFLIYFVSLVPFAALLAALALSVFLAARTKKFGYLFVAALALLNGLLYHNQAANRYKIQVLDQIVADVKALTAPGDSIFGAWLVTPIVALYGDRAITNHEGDTNNQRFLTGLITVDSGTRLATESSLFLQVVVLDEETGEVKNSDPGFIDNSIVIAACTPQGKYPVEQDFGFNWLVVWKCAGS